MIAPTLTNGLQLSLTGKVTSVPYIEMTLSMMQEYGIRTEWNRESMVISVTPQTYQAREYFIESDWSASSYWYQIMGPDFMYYAFKYAREYSVKYAKEYAPLYGIDPEDEEALKLIEPKLFYNDYNEFQEEKKNAIICLLTTGIVKKAYNLRFS